MSYFSIGKIVKRGVVNAMFFSTLWGSWAYYANMHEGHEAAFRATTTQFLFTLFNTFFYSVLMEYMYTLGKSRLSRFVLAALIPSLLVTVVLVYLHYLRGTPEIFVTVAPSLSVLYVVSLVYVFLLRPRKELSANAA